MSKFMAESFPYCSRVKRAASVPTSSISWSSVTNSPARVLSFTGTPPRRKATN
ncbi:MAG: hypothetical protein U0V56_10365 [Actinomycetota bacterium]